MNGMNLENVILVAHCKSCYGRLHSHIVSLASLATAVYIVLLCSRYSTHKKVSQKSVYSKLRCMACNLCQIIEARIIESYDSAASEICPQLRAALVSGQLMYPNSAWVYSFWSFSVVTGKPKC